MDVTAAPARWGVETSGRLIPPPRLPAPVNPHVHDMRRRWHAFETAYGGTSIFGPPRERILDWDVDSWDNSQTSNWGP